MSLSGVFRLKKSYQFNYVYRKGKTVSDDFLILHYAKNNTGKPKVGLSVPRKYGKAAARNLFKRRMRSAFAELLPETDGRYNYVLTPRSEASGCSYGELSVRSGFCSDAPKGRGSPGKQTFLRSEKTKDEGVCSMALERV